MKAHPLKVERERRGWSQARVAEALGVSNRTVTRWELRRAIPYPYYREQLAQLFGKSVRELDLLPPEQPPGSPPELAQEPALALAAASSPTVSPPPPLLLDPAIPLLLGRTGSLVGRAALLAQIKARLFAGQTLALTALDGLPGVGKTALAVAVSLDAEVQAHFAQGILWAGLGPHPDRLGALSRWGTLLGVRATIGKRRLLLIIDDAWSAQEALSLQVGGPQCAHLLTTRSPQVAFAFAQAGSLSVPELSEPEGLELLARFVPQVVQQEREQAQALVRAVSGLPLALSLVGKYLASQSLPGQPRRLRLSVPTPLLERAPHLPEYVPLSLQATIAVSERYLSQQARACWDALAVFPARPNSFSEEAALAVSQQGEAGLDGLWDAGLLESSGPGRYSLHQTIADYGRARGEQREAQARLVSYTLSWLQAQERDDERLELEASNLLAALEAAIALGMRRELIAGIEALVPFLERRGRYVLADHYLQQAYEAAVALGEPLSQLRLLEHLAHFAGKRGEYPQAERYAGQGLELARAQGQLETQSALLTTLAQVAMERGEYARALQDGEQGLQLARQVGASERICHLLYYLIWIAIRQGRHEDALSLAQEGLELARQAGIGEMVPFVLAYLGKAVGYQGDEGRARTCFEESLRLARQAQAIGQLSEVLVCWGDVSLHFQRLEEAEAAYQELLSLQASGELDAQTKARARYGLARVAGQRGQMSAARRLGQESLAAYEALGHHHMAAEVAHWMQTLSSLQGDAPPTSAENAPGPDLPGG